MLGSVFLVFLVSFCFLFDHGGQIPTNIVLSRHRQSGMPNRGNMTKQRLVIS